MNSIASIQRRLASLLLLWCLFLNAVAMIDRRALVERNSPVITSIDTLGSLSVGNGEFAFTCDVTGLQTFHALYSRGVPLGTMAQWGWHSFPNDGDYRAEEVLRPYDFGRGAEEWYSCQLKDDRGKAASDYLRANPHRLHLGVVAFCGIEADDLSDIHQWLDLWNGRLVSDYRCNGNPMHVVTTCHPQRDRVVAQIKDPERHSVELRFPYPTGKHSDDACDWSESHPHNVRLVAMDGHSATFCHTLDNQCYYIRLTWQGASRPTQQGNTLCLTPQSDRWSMSVEFSPTQPDEERVDYASSVRDTRRYWRHYWQKGGAVDFSHCTDSRARELERRVVLSQYLTAIQCAGSTPPQETGLTYNSWFGKFHLEMTWWHEAHFALWGHPELLARTLPWYHRALPMAQQIASRQHLDGARWMKMTDPSAAEAPSNVGSFLVWQQPHLIYLCELLYRATHKAGSATLCDAEVLRQYAPLVEQTAACMASLTTYDAIHQRYLLKGCIPAQETLKASETINPPFELSYWHFAFSVAQQWRERQGVARDEQWDRILASLSPLCAKDGLYAASENSPSYALLPKGSEQPNALASDHMAVLAACGVLPESPQYDLTTMKSTLRWVLDNWNWNKTWGWDFPTTAMTAIRCGEPELALDALLRDCRTNTYLPNGHNYQDGRLRCYLPGNGGLLTAVALMCAGYDGCSTSLPGFPHDGTWDVRYEGILPMP